MVIDEAHRSVYRKYKAIFEYFDSLLVGLTATPKDEVDRDTYRLFDLQTGVPTDNYNLDEAVKDGFLLPPKAVSLTTDFLDRGIRYDQLSDEEKEAWDALEWQFDLVVFRAELALLHVDPAFNDLRTRITEIASLLEELPNVPTVAAEMELILEIQTDEFWQDITLPMLETVRRRLRALVKLIEYKKRTLVYSDFEDSAGAAANVMVPGIPVGTDMDAFRRKARLFLKPHENQMAVLKVKRNQPLTPTDLKELERIFLEAGVDETALERYRPKAGFRVSSAP